MVESSLPSAPAVASARDDGIAIVVLTNNRVHLLQKCVENVLLVHVRRDQRDRDLEQRLDGRDGAYLDSLDDPRITVVHSEQNIGQNAYAARVPS